MHTETIDVMPGLYDLGGQNAGKPFFQKIVHSGSVFLYFCDGSVDPLHKGWWFGPQFEGEEVWAFCPGDVPLPPRSGWRRPPQWSVDDALAVSMGTYLCAYKHANGIECVNPRPVHHPLCVHGACFSSLAMVFFRNPACVCVCVHAHRPHIRHESHADLI